MRDSVTDPTTAQAARQHEFSRLALLLQAEAAETRRAIAAAEAARDAARPGEARDRHTHAVEYLTPILALRTRLQRLFEDAQSMQLTPADFRAALEGRE